MARKTAQPWRVLPVIDPSVYVRPAGIAKMRSISRRFVAGVGFSNGWAEFALKKPPPFVPSSLIASCEATGPSGTACVAPSSVVTFVEGEKLWTTPCDIRTTAATSESGRRTQSVARVRSTQKLPIVRASARPIPRITATATAMPVAADRKL